MYAHYLCSVHRSCEAKKILYEELQRGVSSPDARAYWGGRVRWTTGAEKTFAQGGKNYRGDAYGLVVNRILTAVLIQWEK